MRESCVGLIELSRRCVTVYGMISWVGMGGRWRVWRRGRGRGRGAGIGMGVEARGVGVGVEGKGMGSGQRRERPNVDIDLPVKTEVAQEMHKKESR